MVSNIQLWPTKTRNYESHGLICMINFMTTGLCTYKQICLTCFHIENVKQNEVQRNLHPHKTQETRLSAGCTHNKQVWVKAFWTEEKPQNKTPALPKNPTHPPQFVNFVILSVRSEQ